MTNSNQTLAKVTALLTIGLHSLAILQDGITKRCEMFYHGHQDKKINFSLSHEGEISLLITIRKEVTALEILKQELLSQVEEEEERVSFYRENKALSRAHLFYGEKHFMDGGYLEFRHQKRAAKKAQRRMDKRFIQDSLANA